MLYQLERYISQILTMNNECLINKSYVQYSKLILVSNNIVYLWPWIYKIFHENCEQVSKFYP
jgi:uncharacterized membrane protein